MQHQRGFALDTWRRLIHHAERRTQVAAHQLVVHIEIHLAQAQVVGGIGAKLHWLAGDQMRAFHRVAQRYGRCLIAFDRNQQRLG